MTTKREGPKASGENKKQGSGDASDDPSRYEGHDENRLNAFDPENAKAIGMKEERGAAEEAE